MSLRDILIQRYGNGLVKEAKPDFAPGVKEKGIAALSKKDPALASAAAATGSKGTKKASVSAGSIFDFKMGKVASAGFMDELRKLNEATAKLLNKEAVEESPLHKAIRACS